MIMWDEDVEYHASVEIEADDEDEALELWKKGEFGDYDRDERNNKFDYDSVEIEEVEP
jgi:hypothetical protein